MMARRKKPVRQLKEEGFEEVKFPPPLPASLHLNQTDGAHGQDRKTVAPITEELLSSLLDSDGRLVDEHRLRQMVFQGGSCPEARKAVWQFLFGLYPFHSTRREREVLLADYHMRYAALKHRWKMFLTTDLASSGAEDKLLCPSYLKDIPEPETDSEQPVVPLSEAVKQQLDFMKLQAQVYASRQSLEARSLIDAIQIIDKDVPRTDRELEYFSGKTNPHLRTLRDVLITYACFHPHVGYAQGMNDLVSRFLVVLNSEVEAYWCFKQYMDHVQADFMEDRMLDKLKLVQQLLQDVDPDLYKYLEHMQVADMAFCHRWLLLCFKREFSAEDSLRCFEMLSSHHLELSSLEAQKAWDQECRKDFEQLGGKNRVAEAPLNTDISFDVFICVGILIANRDVLFACVDVSGVFQFVSNMTMKMDLTSILQKAETLFFNYCRQAVNDCFQVIDTPSPAGSGAAKHSFNR